MGITWGSPAEPETLAEQLARYAAHRRHVRRGKAITALAVVALAGASVAWPPLLLGLASLAAYCAVMAGLWHGLNRLGKARARRRLPAAPAPDVTVRIVVRDPDRGDG